MVKKWILTTDYALNHGMDADIFLLDLPYFDPVRMTVVDPMLLGTARHLIKNIWIQHGILNRSAMATIHQKLIALMFLLTYICSVRSQNLSRRASIL